nr:putative polyprotein [Tanacetum cinerariifolium]
RSNTKNDRVPSASKSSRIKNKEAEVEEHHRNLLVSKNNKHMSSTCNNSKFDSPDVITKVVCAMCKKCLISVNHDECLVNYVNGKKSGGRKHKANVSKNETQKKYQPKASKPKKVGTRQSLATHKPRKPRLLLMWSPTGRLFDQDGKLVAPSNSESHVDCSNGDNACTSNTMEPKVKWFPNSTSLLGSGRKHMANVSQNETQREYRPKVSNSKNVGTRESLATPKPRKPRFLLRWSPTGKKFDSAGQLVALSGEPDLLVPVPESFHEQTDEELTKNDIKRMDADDQAIQTILLGIPEDVYAAVDSYETTKKIWKHVRQMMKGSDIEEHEKKAKLFNEWEKFTHVTIVRQTKNLHEADFTQIHDFLKMNQDEDRQTQNVGGNGWNHFGQYAGQVAHNQQGYNTWQNGIANPNGTGNVVAARAEGIQLHAEEFDFIAAACDLDEIEEVNANCILIANLQHASTSDLLDDTTPSVAQKFLNKVKSSLVTLQRVVKQKMTLEVQNWSSSAHKEIQFLQEAAKFVRDFKSLTKEADESLDKQKSLELKIERILKASVIIDIMSIVQNGFVDVPSDLRTELDQRLQAQLRDLKGKSYDTPSALNTLDPLNQKLESKIVELEFQVVNYERKISHLKTTYKNLFDSITSNQAHAKLYNLIYENAQLRAWVFENTSEFMNNTSRTSVTPHVDKPKLNAYRKTCTCVNLKVSLMSIIQAMSTNSKRRFEDDILVVHVYVDDIIFGSTNHRYAILFSDLMKSRFEMSMMGEMTFFLGLQVNQSPSDTTPTVTPPTTHVDTTLTPTEIPRVSPIILPSPDYTPTSPDYSPASDTEFDPSEDPSSDHIPPLPATLPFLSSFNDSSDNDTPDTAPSLTHGTPFTEICPPTQSSPAASVTLHRRVMILAPGQPIHHDLFTFDDSSETSSDSSSDDLSDSSFGHSSSDHSSPALPSGMRSSHQLCSSGVSIPYSSTVIIERPSHSSFVGPSRKRSRSPTTSVLLSLPIPRALSSARADLLPPPKRIRSDDFVTDLENCMDKSSDSSVPRETSLRDDVVVRGCDEPHSEPNIDPKILADIDECIAYVDALRAEGINARVVVETVAREEVETRDPVKVKVKRVTHPAVPDDIPKPAQKEGAIEGTCETLGDMGHKTVMTCQQSVVLSKRISQLERDNTRLRGTLDVASQRVSRLQRRELKIPNTLSGATMTREEVNELIARRVAEALEARDAVRNLEPFVEGRGEQEDKNGDDYGGGIKRRNRNRGNGNGGGNGNGRGDENGNGNGNKGMAITLKVSCLLLESAHIWTS